MLIKETGQIRKIIFFLTILSLGSFFAAQNIFASPTEEDLQEEIDTLRSSIDGKKDVIDKMKKESLTYEANIRAKQKESLTISNELEILDNKVAKTILDIQINEKQIEENKSEIKILENEIKNLDFKLEKDMDSLKAFIKVIHKNDQKSPLYILVGEQNFSSYFSQVEFSKELQSDIKNVLKEVKQNKNLKVTQKDALQIKRDELVAYTGELEQNKIKLEEEQRLKIYYLQETKSSEEKFQKLLWEVKQEEYSIRNEISAIEKEVREKLEVIAAQKQNSGDTGIYLTNANLIWPVDSAKGISAVFHDPDYPFRHIFEHPGIDIRVSQGTAIQAAADAYVAKAKDNGYGYSYIMLIHADGFSTVYGHVSRIDVAEDTYVSQGQIIGLSGGMPGTKGAGNLSTGPHLHFEVRLEGIPVNPEIYLP